jgi:TonB family protein
MSHPIGKLLVAATTMTLALAGHAQTSTSDTSAPATDKPAPAPAAPRESPKVCKRPEYPKSALMVGATGTSSLSFLIGTDGSVRDAKVLKSSGHASLDQAALSALSLCHFKPATDNGKPVETWQPVQYVWSIE